MNNMKILIVDDLKENRYLLETMLKGDGFEIVSAVNGSEALERLRSEGFDMIISDILMPIMDGFQLCRKVKKDDRLKVIPFVFYTATYTGEKDEELALKLGADKFLRKPMDPDEFMTAIRAVIEDADKGILGVMGIGPEEKEEVLKLYSERLVKKLEKKMLDLEKEVAERKQVEEALRESEEKHRTLFETMIQGIVYQAASGEIISANPAAEKILGLTSDQMQGRTSMDPRWRAIHEDGSDFSGESHPSTVALRTGKEVTNVVMGVFNPNDDQTHWININAVPQFKSGERDPYQAYTAFEDITERKRAEEALRESKEKYRSLIANIPDVIWSTDIEGNTSFISSNVEKVYGFKPEEIYESGEKLWFGRIHPDDVERVKGEFRGLFEDKDSQLDVEYRIKRKDGEWIWLRDRSTGTYEKHGNKFADGIFTDITERKKAERELEIQKIYMKELFESAPEAIAILDNNDRIQKINRYFTNLFGYSSSEAIGCKINDLVLPADLKAEGMKATADVAAGERIFLETVRQNKDGQSINVSILGHPITIEGDQRGVYGIYRDITERKRTEVALKKRKEELERFNTLAVGRELKMVELKKEINALLGQSGKAPRYKIVGEDMVDMTEGNR